MKISKPKPPRCGIEYDAAVEDDAVIPTTIPRRVQRFGKTQKYVMKRLSEDPDIGCKRLARELGISSVAIRATMQNLSRYGIVVWDENKAAIGGWRLAK